MSDSISDYWAQQQAIEAAYGEMEAYLPLRAFRALWYTLSAQGLKVTPENVATLTARQLLREPNFGPKSLADVEEWLSHYGLQLEGSPRIVSLHTAGTKPWSMSLHTTEGRPWSCGCSMRLLADALDVLHA